MPFGGSGSSFTIAANNMTTFTMPKECSLQHVPLDIARGTAQEELSGKVVMVMLVDVMIIFSGASN